MFPQVDAGDGGICRRCNEDLILADPGVHFSNGLDMTALVLGSIPARVNDGKNPDSNDSSDA
jgi:hypothetical protein